MIPASIRLFPVRMAKLSFIEELVSLQSTNLHYTLGQPLMKNIFMSGK